MLRPLNPLRSVAVESRSADFALAGYELRDADDGRRYLIRPDGVIYEVDYDLIFQLADGGELVGRAESEQMFIRYLCGSAEAID